MLHELISIIYLLFIYKWLYYFACLYHHKRNLFFYLTIVNLCAVTHKNWYLTIFKGNSQICFMSIKRNSQVQNTNHSINDKITLPTKTYNTMDIIYLFYFTFIDAWKVSCFVSHIPCKVLSKNGIVNYDLFLWRYNYRKSNITINQSIRAVLFFYYNFSLLLRFLVLFLF